LHRPCLLDERLAVAPWAVALAAATAGAADVVALGLALGTAKVGTGVAMAVEVMLAAGLVIVGVARGLGRVMAWEATVVLAAGEATVGAPLAAVVRAGRAVEEAWVAAGRKQCLPKPRQHLARRRS